MAKEKDTTTSTQSVAETVTAPAGQQAPKQQLRIDESGVSTTFSSTTRIWGSAEEIIVDFSQGIRPSGQPNTAILKIDSRVVMTPWAAKRLALALGQTVARYEQAYGSIEIDPRRRVQNTTKA